MPKSKRKFKPSEEVEYELAVERIGKIAGTIDLLGHLLMSDAKLLGRSHLKVEQCAHELWNTGERLEGLYSRKR